MDAFLEKNNIHVILAIVAEGIPEYPEWVQYIKERQHRYTIQLHGLSHPYYKAMTEDEGYRDLLCAKWMIEKEFDIQVTRWYVPFGRLYFPEWSLRVCERLGIKLNNAGSPAEHHYFHFWNSWSRLRLKKLYEFKSASNRSMAENHRSIGFGH